MGESRNFAIRRGFQAWALKLSRAIADGHADREFLEQVRCDVEGIMQLINAGIRNRGVDVALVPIGGPSSAQSMYDNFSAFRVLLLGNLEEINEIFLSTIVGELGVMLDLVTRELCRRELEVEDLQPA
jgi:hypothetical protein